MNGHFRDDTVVTNTREGAAPGVETPTNEARLARLAALVEMSGEAMLSVTPDGTILAWNPAAEKLFGYREAEAVGRNITLITTHRDHTSDGIAGAVMREGRVMRVRAERIHKDGTKLPVLITAAPMRDRSGGIFGASSVIRDLSNVLRAEERQRMMMRELAHRGKNMLAVVQSVARRSFTDADCSMEARDRFIERIAAMARTYQTLNADGFAGARLSELIRLELEPFESRAAIEGPDILVRTNIAQIFGMMLHELATNAFKHGSLSTAAGRVSVRWTVEDRQSESVFRFEWIESGGPPVLDHDHHGFVAMLITGIVQQSFNAEPIVEFLPEGLSYSFETAFSNIGKRLERTPVRARIRSSRMRAFYDAWWRDDGELTNFASIAVDLEKVSDTATVVEVDVSLLPAGLRIISRGRNLAKTPPAPDSFGDFSERDVPGSTEATLRRCARLREAIYEFSMIDENAPDTPVLERLFVPCSRDGKSVTHIISLAIDSNGD